ncbi:MAG: cyclodeaminase/cyclohydrolase family protein [Oscillospiraceae bacterium]|nr:cyclodeaminase/cyclohydrolase family protein [Oscillospiraceae bacterium]
MMREYSLDEFAACLAAKQPVPGGGGAAALCGALAAALGSMVANYTLGKKKYADYEAEITALLDECGSLRARFLELIEEDAEAFEPLSSAYGISKDDPGRDEKLERCLNSAARVPLEIAKLAARIIEISSVLAKKGSVLMISDAGCAAQLAFSALNCAALNVKVNTRLMKNREEAEKLNSQLAELGEYEASAKEIYASVYTRLSDR